MIMSRRDWLLAPPVARFVCGGLEYEVVRADCTARPLIWAESVRVGHLRDWLTSPRAFKVVGAVGSTVAVLADGFCILLSHAPGISDITIEV